MTLPPKKTEELIKKRVTDWEDFPPEIIPPIEPEPPPLVERQ